MGIEGVGATGNPEEILRRNEGRDFSPIEELTLPTISEVRASLKASRRLPDSQPGLPQTSPEVLGKIIGLIVKDII